MKQLLYTCARCNKQVVVEPRFMMDPNASMDPNLPMGWAESHYRRIHTAVQDDKQCELQTACAAHACGDCAKSVLDFIEPPQSMQRQSA